jgi:hypothetical protein
MWIVLLVTGGLVSSLVSGLRADSENDFSLTTYYMDWKSASTLEEMETLARLKGDLPLTLDRETRIVQSYSLPPVYNRISEQVFLALTYDNFLDIQWFNDPDYVIIDNDQNLHPELSGPTKETEVGARSFSKSPLEGLLQTGIFGSQTCKRAVENENYLIFKCERLSEE